MATITEKYTESWHDTQRSTWTLSFSGSGNYTVGESNGLTFNAPSLAVSYAYAGNKTLGHVDVYTSIKIQDSPAGAFQFRYKKPATTSTWGKMNPGETYGAGIYNSTSSVTLATSAIFTSANATKKTLNIGFKTTDIHLASTNTEHTNENGTDVADAGSSYKSFGTVTLNAPPKYTNATLTTSGQAYKKAYTVTVNMTGVSAQYGGTISSIKFQIGNQSVTRTTSGTLSITVEQAGTFTPTVTITDSRGQVTTKTFSAITIAANTCDLTSLDTERISATTGGQQDDGTNAVVILKTTYTSALTTNYLNQPTVKLNGTTTAVTWYSSWDADDGFSDPITWNSSFRPTSPATIYGKVTSTLNANSTYRVSAQISTPYATSTTIETNVAQAFYLLSGRAGGHGLGIGMKAPTDDFYVGMDEYLFDSSGIVTDLAALGWGSVASGSLVNLQALLEKLLGRLSLFGKELSMSVSSWSSGTCTVTDSSKYMVFLIVQGGGSLIAYRDTPTGTTIRGDAISGNAASGNYNQYVRVFGATTSGDVWTHYWSKQLSHVTTSGYHTSGAEQAITAIYGLIPKPTA